MKHRPPIFAFLHDGEAKVKRLQLYENGTASVISDNADYAPYLAAKGSFTMIGKVVWWGHSVKE